MDLIKSSQSSNDDIPAQSRRIQNISRSFPEDVGLMPLSMTQKMHRVAFHESKHADTFVRMIPSFFHTTQNDAAEELPSRRLL